MTDQDNMHEEQKRLAKDKAEVEKHFQIIRRELDERKPMLGMSQYVALGFSLGVLAERIAWLEGFKEFVHKRLTDMKIPEQFPDGVHSKAGCRIGDRLEFVDHLLTNPLVKRITRNEDTVKGELDPVGRVELQLHNARADLHQAQLVRDGCRERADTAEAMLRVVRDELDEARRSYSKAAAERDALQKLHNNVDAINKAVEAGTLGLNKEVLFTEGLRQLINSLSLESQFGNYADYVLAQRVWNNLTATARVDKVVAEASDMTFDPYLDVHMKKTLLDVTDQGRAAHRLLVDGHRNASGPETWIPDLAAIRERKITEAKKALGGFPDNWWVHRANHTGKVGEEQEVASLNYLLQFQFEEWAGLDDKLARVKFLEKNLRARWRLMLTVHPNGGATWRSVPL